MRAQRTRAFVISSVLAKRTVGDGWSRSGVIGGGRGIGCGVHGKHVLQCGGPEVRPVEDNEDIPRYRQSLAIVAMAVFRQ